MAWQDHSFLVVEDHDEIKAVSMWTEEEVRQPLDYAPEMEEYDRYRQNMRRIAFWCCVAFIAGGAYLTWLLFR